MTEAKQQVAQAGAAAIDMPAGPSEVLVIADAGADTFVAGSAIFGTPDYKAVIDAMRAELAK